MKKRLLFACFIGLLGTAGAFADHPEGWGIGVFSGGGGGTVRGGLFHPGLSLKAPGAPVYFGVNAIFGRETGFGLTGDYYILDRDLVSAGAFDLDWYLGVGGFGHFYFGAFPHAGLGVRVPVGLSWRIHGPAELFFSIVPGLGLGVNFYPPVYFVGSGELGLRFWF
jgi:hypothetical protein